MIFSLSQDLPTDQTGKPQDQLWYVVRNDKGQWQRASKGFPRYADAADMLGRIVSSELVTSPVDSMMVLVRIRG